jgi:hypothetical protein
VSELTAGLLVSVDGFAYGADAGPRSDRRYRPLAAVGLSRGRTRGSSASVLMRALPLRRDRGSNSDHAIAASRHEPNDLPRHERMSRLRFDIRRLLRNLPRRMLRVKNPSQNREVSHVCRGRKLTADAAVRPFTVEIHTSAGDNE